jgi:hypothetical protein
VRARLAGDLGARSVADFLEAAREEIRRKDAGAPVPVAEQQSA